MFKRYLAFILLTVLVLTSFVIPTYADTAIGEIGTEEMEPIENDRVPLKDSYTEEEIKSILAGDHNFDIPEEGIKFSAENFPLEVDENVVSPDVAFIEEDDYYITVLETGEILWSPNASYVTKISYSESEVHMWVFDEVSAFTYTIRNKFDPSRCLAVSQTSTGVYSVVTKTYSATDTTCHWSMSITSDGNYIQSEAAGTSADGQYLYLSGKRFLLNSSKRTYIGLVDVDAFVPCTAISMGEYISVPYGSNATFSILETTPSNANLLGNLYMTYTIANSSVCSLNVTNKRLTGLAIGSTTLTATHKMTGATCTVDVYVGYPTKVKAYYDYAFKALCESYTEFNNIPGAQIEEWFEKVKKKYAEDLDIHLILVSTTLCRSYPETLDAYGRTDCLTGEHPNAECTCSTVCENSTADNLKSLHHKNICNIFHRMPEPNVNQNLNVFFTGHNICCDTVNGHDAGYTWGVSNRESGCAIIATNYVDYISYSGFTDNLQCEEFMISVLAHEIGHLFQNPGYDLDHNGILSSDEISAGMDNSCIYGLSKTNRSIYSTLKICDYCTDVIKGNASRYNHR